MELEKLIQLSGSDQKRYAISPCSKLASSAHHIFMDRGKRSLKHSKAQSRSSLQECSLHQMRPTPMYLNSEASSVEPTSMVRLTLSELPSNYWFHSTIDSSRDSDQANLRSTGLTSIYSTEMARKYIGYNPIGARNRLGRKRHL